MASRYEGNEKPWRPSDQNLGLETAQERIARIPVSDDEIPTAGTGLDEENEA